MPQHAARSIHVVLPIPALFVGSTTDVLAGPADVPCPHHFTVPPAVLDLVWCDQRHAVFSRVHRHDWPADCHVCAGCAGECLHADTWAVWSTQALAPPWHDNLTCSAACLAGLVLPLHACVTNGTVLCAQVVCLGAGVIARTSQATSSSSLEHWADSAIDVASNHHEVHKQEPVTVNVADYPLQVLWRESGGFPACSLCGHSTVPQCVVLHTA